MNDRLIVGLSLFCMGVSQVAYSDQVPSAEIQTVLRLREQVSMEKLADNVSNPASPLYRQYYTPEQIRDLSAPSQEDYSALLDQLKSKGFSVVSESKTHLFITISGDKSLFEKTFETQISYNEKGLHRASQDLKIPSEIALIRSVSGLDNTRSSRPMFVKKSVLRSETVRPLTDDSLTPSYIKSAYGFDAIYAAGFTGLGQHIAIATYDGFYTEDIPMYFAQMNLSPSPQVDVIEFNGKAYINDDSAQETELDTEFSGTIAPNAQIHVFTSAQNSDAGEVQLFTAILDDNRAKIVNYSWGDCEPNETAQHAEDMQQIFARAVAQGVNVMVASGDSGAEGCPEQADFTLKKYNATFPASIPYVVAVGGTSVNGGDNGDVRESAWDQSGGGVSEIYALPGWQSGFLAPFSMRSFPDVAFNADPNNGQDALVHDNGPGLPEMVQFGGTSIAAPQWSGFLALVGEARAATTPVGYLNPIIYGLTSDQQSQVMRDVTSGGNGGYKATAGWDATTGWGSMRASDLFNLLKSN